MMVANDIGEKPLKIDKAIATARYILKKKKERVDRLGRNIELSENQKIFMGQETELIQIIELLVNECKKYVESNLGKIPPQAADMEEGVLGAILLEQPSLSKVSSFLKPEHFYKECNEEIYSAILELNNSNESVDLRSVVFKLRQNGKIEKIGGATYLAHLMGKTSSTALIERDARILIELAIKRQLILTSSEVHYECYSEATDCFEILERAENSFKQIKSWLIQ